MSIENLNNEACIGLSLLNAELDSFQARADNAYIKYIGLCKQDGCLGWEIKVEKGWFGAGELEAHKAAAAELGRHRALQEMVTELRKLISMCQDTQCPSREECYRAKSNI